jgi:hypothetical protein
MGIRECLPQDREERKGEDDIPQPVRPDNEYA